MSAWSAGDARAGEALVTRHYLAVARFFTNQVGAESDAEDLIQQTFLGCLEGVSRFRGQASFRTFLFAIARNKLLKHMRKRSKGRIFLNPSWHRFAAGLRSNTSILGARDERQLLNAAMQRLPLETQMMLELHYWQGLSIAEVARVVERPPNTVKTRMFRARQRIARELQDAQT